MKKIELAEIYFEVKDIFGRSVRTTRNYWQKIFLVKHKELRITKENVIETLKGPDEVRISLQDFFIYLFYKKIFDLYIVIVVKYIGEQGFIVTIYQTSKVKRKGTKIWQKQK